MARSFSPANNDYIHYGDIHELDSGDYTIAARIFPTNSSNTGYVVSKFGGGNGFYFRRQGTSGIGMGVNNGPVTYGSMTLDVWNTVMIHFSSGTMTVYVDNSSVASTSMASPNANAANLGLGNRDDLARDYEGEIAEVAIWEGVALDADQRQAIQDAGHMLATNVKPDFYAPLVNNVHNLIGGQAGTDVNGTGKTAHPPKAKSFRAFNAFSVAAAGGTTVLNQIQKNNLGADLFNGTLS